MDRSRRTWATGRWMRPTTSCGLSRRCSKRDSDNCGRPDCLRGGGTWWRKQRRATGQCERISPDERHGPSGIRQAQVMTERAMATLRRVAVSLRHSPQPFKGLMLFWALAVVAELVGAIAGLGGGIRNGLVFALGLAFALLGAALVLNVNGCADYMRSEIRRDAPYGYDYWRHAFAEGP